MLGNFLPGYHNLHVLENRARLVRITSESQEDLHVAMEIGNGKSYSKSAYVKSAAVKS